MSSAFHYCAFIFFVPSWPFQLASALFVVHTLVVWWTSRLLAYFMAPLQLWMIKKKWAVHVSDISLAFLQMHPLDLVALPESLYLHYILLNSLMNRMDVFIVLNKCISAGIVKVAACQWSFNADWKYSNNDVSTWDNISVVQSLIGCVLNAYANTGTCCFIMNMQSSILMWNKETNPAVSQCALHSTRNIDTTMGTFLSCCLQT